MPADAMVHLDDGRHRTLTEASHSTHGELAVRRGQQQFVGFVSVAVTVLDTQSQVEASALQQVARTTGMTRRPAANADAFGFPRLPTLSISRPPRTIASWPQSPAAPIAPSRWHRSETRLTRLSNGPSRRAWSPRSSASGKTADT